MGDLYPSVSPFSCHCTQWVGVASWMTENKHSSSQTTDISYQCDKSLLCLPVPPCVSFRLAGVGSVVNRSASFA